MKKMHKFNDDLTLKSKLFQDKLYSGGIDWLSYGGLVRVSDC